MTDETIQQMFQLLAQALLVRAQRNKESSTGAEFIAGSSAACQAVWLSIMFSELQRKQDGATNIFCDNQPTICMYRNPVYNKVYRYLSQPSQISYKQRDKFGPLQH